MNRRVTALVIPAKCACNKRQYGIRTEKRETSWCFTWAFPMDEEQSQKEKFNKNTIAGETSFDPCYPGCPHCGSQSVVRCGHCGKVACNGDGGTTFTCPWCGKTSEVTSSSDLGELCGGGY